ncbi:MAG: hypothetical protein ACF8CY_06750 [Gimesia chilikensis]
MPVFLLPFVIPAAIAGVATAAIISVLYYAGQQWWPWALCYFETWALTLAVEFSEALTDAFPELMTAESQTQMSYYLSQLEWWFPVSTGIDAFTFYMTFFAGWVVVRLLWRGTVG